MKTVLCFLIIFIGYNSLSVAQQAFEAENLAVKKRFSSGEDSALGMSFKGVTAKGIIQEGLFPIKATGITTAPIVEAAEVYLNKLSFIQRLRTQFAVDDPEWRKWSNVDNGIYVRQGISLKELNKEQREAAFNLLHSSLSAKGLALSKDIMKTDQTLRELNNGAEQFDEELYYITIMGIPSATEPWGWQIDGHHLVINYFVLGDQIVMTPTFLGGEPVVTDTGKHAGNSILQDEQNRGLNFMQNLSAEQQAKATIKSRKLTDNMHGAANQDNLILDYAGLPVSDLSAASKQSLLKLINLYISNMKEGHARIKMDEIEKHLDDTYFTWVGAASDDAVFYYRIHSPVILIEFDHQIAVGTSHINKTELPIRDHIHIVIRTPNGNDYGKNLLSQHLEQHPH